MRRTRRSTPDRFLYWKVAIFFLAAGLWVAGVVTGQAWLTGAAIVILVAGIVLRWLGARNEDSPDG